MTEDNDAEEAEDLDQPRDMLPGELVPLVFEEMLPNVIRQVPVEFWNADIDWTHLKATINAYLAAADGQVTVLDADRAAAAGLSAAIARWQWDVEALRDEVDGVVV